MTDKPIKSVAAKVLATGDATEAEARRLAGAVLGDDSLTPAKPTKTREELEQLLVKIDGVEGQTERAALIRKQLANMSDD